MADIRHGVPILCFFSVLFCLSHKWDFSQLVWFYLAQQIVLKRGMALDNIRAARAGLGGWGGDGRGRGLGQKCSLYDIFFAGTSRACTAKAVGTVLLSL
ncbi:MAG: hypothetical protein WBO46_07810 [Caldilineaceae bacterium]